jgi:hypothetical protein
MVEACITYDVPAPSPPPAEQESVWVEHTSGYQCQEDLVYESCDQATAHLTENGVQVLECRTATYVVITVCDAPKSLFYQCRIPPDDLSTALDLGWREVEAE